MIILDCWHCHKPGATERPILPGGDADRDLVLCDDCASKQAVHRANSIAMDARVPGTWYHSGYAPVPVTDARLIALASRLAAFWRGRSDTDPGITTLAEIAAAVGSTVNELIGYGVGVGPISIALRVYHYGEFATPYLWCAYSPPSDAPMEIRAELDGKIAMHADALIAVCDAGWMED